MPAPSLAASSGATGPLLAVLIPRGGDPDDAARYTIRRSTVALGRGEDNDVVLDDGSVSAHHAVVRLAGGVWTVEDCGSMNGTWVDGEPVHDRLPMASGSTLRLGSVELVLSPHDRWEDSRRPATRRLPEPAAEPVFMLDLPERNRTLPRVILGLVIVAAVVILGTLLMRAA